MQKQLVDVKSTTVFDSTMAPFTSFSVTVQKCQDSLLPVF
jgi:hypothetical protein